MILQLPLLKFQTRIKTVFLIALTLSFNSLNAQKKKAKSPEQTPKQTLHRVLQDTLFCSGKPLLRLYHLKAEKSGPTEHYVYPLYAGHLSIHIQRKFTGIVGKDSAWYDCYHFKDLNRQAMVKLKSREISIEEQLCKFALFNHYGLDTLKAETFCVLYPELAPETNLQQTKILNVSLLPDRDISLPVLLEDEKLAQGGIVIGSYEYDTIKGPEGRIEQYAIYNSVGALICTATVKPCSDKGVRNYCWSMLTIKNNKFNSMSSKGNDLLQELLKYLINNKYL